MTKMTKAKNKNPNGRNKTIREVFLHKENTY